MYVAQACNLLECELAYKPVTLPLNRKTVESLKLAGHSGESVMCLLHTYFSL